MKRLSVLIFFTMAFIMSGFAQDVMDGIYVKEHVAVRKPIPYYNLREADVTWSKKVWRMLDLREKDNHPLYYPTVPTDGRKNLTRVMLDGVLNEGIVVYAFDMNLVSEFSEPPLSFEEINAKLGAKLDTQTIENFDTGVEEEKIIATEPKPEEVYRMLMKEEWAFDKQRAKMEVRIIGLAPVRWYVNDVEGLDLGEDDTEKVRVLSPLFWAYFPSYRNIFAQQEVFNPYNDAERRTFEDIFFKRKFASHIYRITNVYNNREILDYKKGEDALLEAEEIKDFMFKFEHDLWEF